jgi:3-carboxy-cis,cis-muconate cycloisomerase
LTSESPPIPHTAGELFAPIFVPDAIREAVSSRAWLQAMLDAERALAAAQARAGVIPQDAASAIAEVCRAERFDAEQIGHQGRAAGNPVVPLVAALREMAPGDSGGFVHWGATSQDVLDTAAVLVARHALELIGAELDGAAAACARLADEHRSTLMAARTLLQQALPTTFGLKSAGWLIELLDAREALDRCSAELPVQLGGAAGTLAAFGPDGLNVLHGFAQELQLAVPTVPWHSNRVRIAALGAMLAINAGALGKIALDVELLSQTEVGEVSEPITGGSSTMPHKRNPVGSILTRACARRARALAGGLIDSMEHEHERAAGAWQAEWESFGEALAMTGGAASAMHSVLDGLEVNVERMRANLDRSEGLLLAEHAVFVLARKRGRSEAKRIVDAAVELGSLRDGLARCLAPDELERTLDPENYLGSNGALIDRALERWRTWR